MTHSIARPLPQSSRALLARVLDQPDLPAQIQALPPAVLGKLVDEVGLEDAGEIVALATTEQLARMFDDDLWKSDRPGEDERFDPARFLVWLEVMMEAGDAFVAKRLSELPEDLVTLAFHRHLLVVSTERLAAEIEGADEPDQVEKALASCLYEELDEYQLLARSPDGWDALLGAILALDRDHHALLVRVLDRCEAMSSEQLDDGGGLYEVLTSEDMLEADVAGDREDRRAEEGFVAPSTAKSFLELARQGLEPAPEGHDAVTKAYFRGLARPAGAAKKKGAPRDGAGASLLLPAGDPTTSTLAPSRPEPLLIQGMRLLAADDPAAFAQRSEELAYLANALVAGCAFRGHRMRPIEGVRCAIATCSLGLFLAAPKRRTPVATDAAAMLKERTADGLFRAAWHHLEKEVAGPARVLRAARPALDKPSREALSALAAECPVLAGALSGGGGEALFESPADVEKARRFLAEHRGAAPRR